MTASICLPLTACRALPVSQVGTLARQLTEWENTGVPLAPSFVIPQSVWAEALEHSRLSEALQHWATAAIGHSRPAEELASELHQLLKQLKLPPAVHQALLHCYQRQLGNQPVLVRSSSTQAGGQHHNRYVADDSNLVAAVLKTWKQHCITAATTQHLPHQLSWAEWGGAVIITQYPDAVASGQMTTIQPFTHSKVITIRSQWGVFAPQLQLLPSDEFRVDPRTTTIVHRQLATKPLALRWKNNELETAAVPKANQARASLTDDQILALATAAWKAKHHSFDHLQLQWAIVGVGQKLQIIDVQPLTAGEHLAPVLAQLLSHGRALQSGYVQQHCWVEGKSTTRRPFAAGDIMVVKNCTTAHLPMLRQASGLISQEAIKQPQVIHAIREFHLPSIDKATNCTTTIRDHQEVILHATKGQVLAVHPGGAGANAAAKSAPEPQMVTELVINHAPTAADTTQPEFTRPNTQRLVPCVHDAAQLAQHLATTKRPRQATAATEWWPELCTPLALLELPELLKMPIGGVIINTAQLGAHLIGQPVEKIELQSQLWSSAMEQLLKMLRQTLAAHTSQLHPPIWITVHAPTHHIIREVIRSPIQGIVAPPEVAATIKPVIMETEQEVFSSGRRAERLEDPVGTVGAG